jgi:hypothetical protein
MAGDWIKIEHSLPDKPEVMEMAQILGIDPDAVVGKLIRVWTWFDNHTDDGNANVTVRALLDRYTGVTNFIVAMQDVGWMSEREGMLAIGHFDRHNGQTAKARANTNRRVAKSRECNAGTVTNVTPAPLQKPLPETRRDEKNIISLSGNDNGDPESVTLPEGAPAEAVTAWAEWQAYRQSRAAAKGAMKYPWTEQAARMGANQMMMYIGTHGIRAVCDRVASAISSNWKGINLDSMECSKLASAAPIENQYGPLQPDKWKHKA